jgi:hypothetical protein
MIVSPLADREAAGRQLARRRVVVLVAHADLESALTDDDVLVGRMPMRRYSVTVGHFQADGEEAGLEWIAVEHRNL